MFAIFYIFGRILAKIGISAYDRKGELDRRKKAIEDGSPLWVDRRGAAHHIENDKPFMYVTDRKTWHIIEINPYTHEFVKDLTAQREERIKKESYEKAVQEKRRVYPIGDILDDYKETPGYPRIKGRVWIDRETGKKYVRRKFGPGVWWFINLETGMYEFPDEEYIKDGEKHWAWIDKGFEQRIFTDEVIEKTLDYLNSNQRKFIEMYGLKSDIVWHNGGVK